MKTQIKMGETVDYVVLWGLMNLDHLRQANKSEQKIVNKPLSTPLGFNKQYKVFSF